MQDQLLFRFGFAYVTDELRFIKQVRTKLFDFLLVFVIFPVPSDGKSSMWRNTAEHRKVLHIYDYKLQVTSDTTFLSQFVTKTSSGLCRISEQQQSRSYCFLQRFMSPSCLSLSSLPGTPFLEGCTDRNIVQDWCFMCCHRRTLESNSNLQITSIRHRQVHEFYHRLPGRVGDAIDTAACLNCQL